MHPAPNPPAGGAEPAAWSLAPLARLPPAKKGISAAEKKIVRAVGRGRGGRGRGRGRLVGSGSGGGGGGGTPRAPGGGRTKLVAVLAKHARCGGARTNMDCPTHDGPGRLGLWRSALPAHQMARIASGCVQSGRGSGGTSTHTRGMKVERG